MQRREFIIAAAALGCGAATFRDTLEGLGTRVLQGGWLPLEAKQARAWFLNNTLRPYASQYAQAINGDGRGKVVRLWKAWEQVHGKEYNPMLQLMGDCVGQAMALGISMIDAADIVLGKPRIPVGKQSSEVIYIGSRIQIGKNAIRGEGSTVSWAAQFVQDIGSLPRDNYPDFDVRNYNPDLQVRLSHGRFAPGVPNHIQELCDEFKLRALLIDGGWRQATDFVAAGIPVVVGSTRGFNPRRDREGFLLPEGEWNHALLLCGTDTKSRRQGGCFGNSWGTQWAYGPVHKYGCIHGGFWADAKVIHNMLMQGDSYALIEYNGKIKKRIDYIF